MGRADGPSQRQLRVGELIRQCLAELLGRGAIEDEMIEKAGLTVVEVQASPDLKVATAYIRPLFDCDRSALMRALERNRRRIRGLLSPKLDLKYMPEIRFQYDETADHAQRIDALLRSERVRRDLSDNHED